MTDAGSYDRTPDGHLHALRRLLALPDSAMCRGTLHFVAEGCMRVVAFNDHGGRLLLAADLVSLEGLLPGDWQRLATLLSQRFDDTEMGRLLVLDGCLAMGWSFKALGPRAWSERAVASLRWLLDLRTQWLGRRDAER
jgi:hypothetical protein